MTLPDFLTQDNLGSVRLTGHRIGLLHLIQLYNEGYSAEMLLAEYPSLSLALIHKVIAFYLENQAEMDAYVARCEAEIANQRAAGPAAPTVKELRQRLEAQRQAEGA
jgi:uncharacterized protein (DUF433 family)